ncbi:MAG: phage tail assembly chaperone G [Staphylococcus equorum]
MAKQTKLNFIELITGEKENGEFETKVYFTPKYLPFSELMNLFEKVEEIEKTEEDSGTNSIQEMFKLVAEDIYKNQFTVQELMDGLHAPEAMTEIRAQIQFVSQGEQSEENEKRLKQLLK